MILLDLIASLCDPHWVYYSDPNSCCFRKCTSTRRSFGLGGWKTYLWSSIACLRFISLSDFLLSCQSQSRRRKIRCITRYPRFIYAHLMYDLLACIKVACVLASAENRFCSQDNYKKKPLNSWFCAASMKNPYSAGLLFGPQSPEVLNFDFRSSIRCKRYLCCYFKCSECRQQVFWTI